jgi:hypothetical protein
MEEITKLIEDLQPQAARFDTPIADDLLLCTFPNGIKTWIFTYTTNGFQRRRSIGVYPEMSLADARQALVAARKLQRVEDHLAECGLGSEVVRQAGTTEFSGPPAVQAARRWLERRTIGAAIAGGMMSIALLLGVRQLPYEFFVSIPSLASTAPGPTAPAGAPQAAAARDAAPAPPSPAAAATSPGTAASAPAPASAPPAAGQAEELSPANQALLRAQDKLRGSVAREVLARGIHEGHPLGPFDTAIALEGDGPITLFYFTDLRGMAGRQVLHRWLHEGTLVSEVALQVGEGWLSALHSSATIAPHMTGRWEVRICDASGNALEQETFDLSPTARLSSR